jgi:hypothetical protein
MKITDEQWSQLRRAAFDDDPKRFEALVRYLIRLGIQEHNNVTQRPPMIGDRPYLVCNR